jgi:aspartate kinase
MIVLKYGGSSLETIEKVNKIAERIVERRKNNEDVVVVVSAMGKTTNHLLELANQVASQPKKREIDMLLSTGEQVSSAILSIAINARGYQAISLNGYQAGIITEGLFTKNKIKDIEIEKIKNLVNEGNVVVVTGFQGINQNGDITTLGRGGSDTTAVALAAKLNCRCEIYTDVDGIYGVNPKLFPEAKKLKQISYEEMSELAFLGAKVMEPRAVEIGQKYNVQILVASAHEDIEGTTIKEIDPMLEQRNITGLSVIEHIAMVTINHFPGSAKTIADLFTRLAESEINIDMISQSILSDGLLNISFTCDLNEMDTVKEILSDFMRTYIDIGIVLNTSVSKLSVVGLGMRSQSGVAARLFRLFAENDIHFELVTTSEISISYTISKALIDKSVRIIAQSFGL